ncbi:MAG: FAD-dependent monooxygenase, partial [Burkholderiales bacterium]|nr:FAD-dependent monooxygenase [Burkholderiales bacterium]
SRPARMVIRHDAVEMALDDGTALTAALVVGADGRDSWVRQAAGIGVRRRDYPQHAVVANFRNAEPHRGTARQWFRRDGVLALLPLPDDHVSMVWSAQESVALELMAAEPEVLSVRVAEAAGIDPAALGTVTPAADFELRAMAASKLVAPRLALVGDAAHNVHPLAGQGVNLGFRDVRELIDVLGARGAEPDVGSLSLLRRYERARREDQAVTLAVTDGLQRLFAARAPGVSWIRNVGMALSDRNAGLKQRLMRHALG